MQKIAKQQRRALRQRLRGWRTAVTEASPPWLRRTVGPVVHYADMLLVDHGVFRLFYLNRHRLGHEAWRAAQPAPHQIAAIKALGVRTIVNLRGARVCGSYWLEQSACARHGITLVDYQVRSRAAPSKEEVLGARTLLQSIEYPILLHCKSGADRAGLMSTLYMIVHEQQPVAEAKAQLALKFGHIRQSDTGILDYFFERYLAEAAVQPIEFFDWVETVYDPEELLRTYRSSRWANFITNKLLRRE
ncbi:MAG: fused DSP-PTPase phosphatase/NAD kinase-like protein [Hyphomicrobiaceae bacterium]